MAVSIPQAPARDGADHEVWFWKCWLATQARKYTTPRRLDAALHLYLRPTRTDILNVGSGAANLIGEYVEDHVVGLTCLDLLADAYMQLWHDLGLTPATPIQPGTICAIDAPDASYDLVFCRNALDHCEDVPQATAELVRVCRPGGTIYLRHTAHEGKRMAYHGLHQWNLDVEGEDCIAWTRGHKQVWRFSSMGLPWGHTLDGGRRPKITSVLTRP